MHGTGVIAVVQDVHREYGFTWDADGYHRDLYTIRQTYIDTGGMFWAAVDGGQVVGAVGVTIHGEESELHRLYLLKTCRGTGLGWRLLKTAMDYARSKGCTRMIAWSDVKLPDAHRLYLKNGFVQFGQRICDDPDQSLEHGFRKDAL